MISSRLKQNFFFRLEMEQKRPEILHVLFEADHTLKFKDEQLSAVTDRDQKRIKSLIFTHYESHAKYRHISKTVIPYPSEVYTKYNIEVSYSEALFDRDILDVLEEQVELLKDEDRPGMAASLSLYIRDRPSLISNHLGKAVRVYEDGKHYEFISEESNAALNMHGSAVYEVGDELGLNDRFYVNNPTGQYYELQVTGGGISLNRFFVSVTLYGLDGTVHEVENALVDTGSTTSIFSYDVLRDLNLLHKTRPAKLVGIGSIEGKMLPDIDVEFFGIRTTIQRPRFIKDWRPEGFTGLIGMDLIQMVMWKIEGGDVSVWSEYSTS
jgi:hypothetical protein